MGLGCEADYSPPLNAELRMRGAMPPLPQYISKAWWVIKIKLSTSEI